MALGNPSRLRGEQRVSHQLLSNIFALLTHFTMVRGIEGNEMSTPKQKPASAGPKPNQKSILGFFQKKVGPASSPIANSGIQASSLPTPSPSIALLASSPPVTASSSQAEGVDKENGMLNGQIHHE